MSRPPQRILLVDDDPDLRDVYAAILEQAGYEVSAVADGAQAMEHAALHPVDLLVTDVVMPGCEGIETTRYFAREWPAIPIIAMSGREQYLELARRLGARVVLEKPIPRQRFLDAVRSLLTAG